MGLSSTRTSSRADSVRPSCHYAVGGRDIVLVNRTRYARFFLRTGVGLEIGGRERPFVPAVFLLVNFLAFLFFILFFSSGGWVKRKLKLPHFFGLDFFFGGKSLVGVSRHPGS